MLISTPYHRIQDPYQIVQRARTRHHAHDALGRLLAAYLVRNSEQLGPFMLVLAQITRPGVNSRALARALLKQCLNTVAQRCATPTDCESSPLPNVPDPRLALALQTIVKEPTAPLTVERLATIAGMSRSAFAAAFTATFGHSPMSLVKMMRLRRAASLLTTTTLPVATIARRVGYCSRSNFSLAFRHFYGNDPTRFRRTSMQNPPLL